MSGFYLAERKSLWLVGFPNRSFVPITSREVTVSVTIVRDLIEFLQFKYPVYL